MTTPAVVEFLMSRIQEDEDAALAAEGWKVGSFPDGVLRLHAAHVVRQSKLPAVALEFPCPTCHVPTGATCMAMTPPTHAPKEADEQHATRFALARAELVRRIGSRSHVDRYTIERVLDECESKRRLVRHLIAWLETDPERAEAALEDMAGVYQVRR